MTPAGFNSRLLRWFDRHGRKDLPWQKNPTPYRVWVSEIMLQQTRVGTVIPYYRRFMKAFPNLSRLAGASRDEVLHLWSGLGYYARARNLHAAAREIRDRHKGRFPTRMTELAALPGIGRSTAGAILALSRGERYAILDGNVKRVLARLYGVEGWPGQAVVAARLWELSERLTPHKRVAEYTQAMMDFGATLCTRSRPACNRCPVSRFCVARRGSRQVDFPGRRRRRELPVRATAMVLLRNHRGEVLIERRPPTGIWGGLWSFPEVGTPADVPDWCERCVGTAPGTLQPWPVMRHTFSHFHLDITPVVVWIKRQRPRVLEPDRSVWYNVSEPDMRGFPAPVGQLLRRLERQTD